MLYRATYNILFNINNYKKMRFLKSFLKNFKKVLKSAKNLPIATLQTVVCCTLYI
jgi:hypothetical protein